MHSTTIKSQIDSLQKKIAKLGEEQRRFAESAARAMQGARGKIDQASKTRSDISRKSYLRQADQEQKKAIAAEKKANERAKAAADLERQVTSKQKALLSALKQEQSKADREQAARKRAESLDLQKRRRDELAHARTLANLSATEVRHVLIPPPQPEKLRILYLTTNPDEERPLRTDAEISAVIRELRGVKYRDLIDLKIQPAATPQDLMNGINDHRPHVIHFSGHGNAGLLAFDNASFDAPDSIHVEFDLLAEILSATDSPPTLLVMNACSTLQGSETLLEAVPTLVAMADSVDDAAASVFAVQFYSAIGAGQSVAASLRQAKAALKLALMREDADLPQLAHRDDVDPTAVCLVSERGAAG